jgi:molecular chaperone GrpE
MGEDFKQEHERAASSPPDPTSEDTMELTVAKPNAEATAASEGSELAPDQPGEADSSRLAPSEAETPPAELFVPTERFEALQREKQELYERLLRKQAEFENFRKRAEREKQDFYDYALTGFIQGLLPILDGLERGLLSVSEGETVEGYKKGIELILKQLRDHLAAAGVQPIRATGKMFDPNFHQAVTREESAVLPENEIVEEMQRGYTLKERLLRPSMVKVAVPMAGAEPAAEPLEEAPETTEQANDQEQVQ